MNIKLFESILNLTTLLSQSHLIDTKSKYEYYGDMNLLFKKSYSKKIILKQYIYDDVNIIK